MILHFSSNEYISLESVFERIHVAEPAELWDIAEVLEVRFRECFPDSEFRFLGLPKNREQQIEYLEQIIKLLRNHDEL